MFYLGEVCIVVCDECFVFGDFQGQCVCFVDVVIYDNEFGWFGIEEWQQCVVCCVVGIEQ